jgi:hypothetical protein
MASPPVAALVWYPPLSLHQQFDRADHAVHARVAQIERPGDFDRRANPMGPCGVHYRIEILEQFKGKLPTKAWFVTHKLLYPEMPLSVGEEIVILARDLTRLRADDPFREDLESIRSTLRCECAVALRRTL